MVLTGNSGGPVSPSSPSGNINIIGGIGITSVGDPSTNTITLNATDAFIAYKNVATSPYIVLSTDYYLSVDCSSGAITLKFPNAATLSQSFIVKDRTGSAATNNITITTVGGTIDFDGSTSYILNTAFQSVNLVGNSTSYEIY